MRFRVFLAVIAFFSSCTSEVRVSGVIVEQQSGLPVRGVKVTTIVDIINNQLKLAEAMSTADGRFELRFETSRTVTDHIPVELSKLGYQTSVYNLQIRSKHDTLLLTWD